MSELQPYLKWAGGKRSLAPALNELFITTQCKRVVEPFCGAISVSLYINPKEALLCDDNAPLINLHQTISSNKKMTTLSELNNKEDFTKLRDEFNQLCAQGIYDEKTASLFYYLNRTCYNGLSRFAKKGNFNVSYGKYKKPKFLKDFTIYHKAMKHWVIKCIDYRSTFELMTSQDFCFIDPPYDGGFIDYWITRFRWDDQVKLAELTKNSKSKCILTNSATDRIIELYLQNGFSVFQHEMPRNISSNGNRDNAIEVIAFHNFSEKELKVITKRLINPIKLTNSTYASA